MGGGTGAGAGAGAGAVGDQPEAFGLKENELALGLRDMAMRGGL